MRVCPLQPISIYNILITVLPRIQTTRYHNRHPISPFNTRPPNCGTLVLNAFQEHFFVFFLIFFLWHLIGRYRVINRITHTQRFWLDQSIISPRFRCRSFVQKPFRQQKYLLILLYNLETLNQPVPTPRHFKCGC